MPYLQRKGLSEMTSEKRTELEARAKTIEAALMRYRAKVRAMDAVADKLSAELSGIRLRLFRDIQQEAPSA